MLSSHQEGNHSGPIRDIVFALRSSAAPALAQRPLPREHSTELLNGLSHGLRLRGSDPLQFCLLAASEPAVRLIKPTKWDAIALPRCRLLTWQHSKTEKKYISAGS